MTKTIKKTEEIIISMTGSTAGSGGVTAFRSWFWCRLGPRFGTEWGLKTARFLLWQRKAPNLTGWSRPTSGRSCSSEPSGRSSPAPSGPAAPPPASASSSCCPEGHGAPQTQQNINSDIQQLTGRSLLFWKSKNKGMSWWGNVSLKSLINKRSAKIKSHSETFLFQWVWVIIFPKTEAEMWLWRTLMWRRNHLLELLDFILQAVDRVHQTPAQTSTLAFTCTPQCARMTTWFLLDVKTEMNEPHESLLNRKLIRNKIWNFSKWAHF